MRTYKEVVQRVAYLNENQTDLFGTEFGDLVVLLQFRDAKPYLRPDVKQTEWQASDPKESRAAAEAYIPFAIDKALSHRGLSATRSVSHLSAWVWLNCTDEEVSRWEQAPYEQYGMPKIKMACELLGMSGVWQAQASEKAERMADGLPCYPGCEEGCGR